ncbi:hypothetical protein D3C81_1069430 [compost metagenome]
MTDEEKRFGGARVRLDAADGDGADRTSSAWQYEYLSGWESARFTRKRTSPKCEWKCDDSNSCRRGGAGF